MPSCGPSPRAPRCSWWRWPASAPVILALRTVRDLDRMNAPSALARPRREAPWARVESTSGSAGAWRIEGTASEGTAVFLFANEKFVAAAPVSAGRFRFEGVREAGALSGRRDAALRHDRGPGAPAVPRRRFLRSRRRSPLLPRPRPR